MPFWDALKTEQGYGWNPTPGAGQRNDYSIPLVQGTPIEAPVSGIVLPEHTNGSGDYSYYGRKDWGGEVDVLTFLPRYGGLVNVNVLHFDTINVQPGDVVLKGQTVLGTSGGQTSGGTMPSSPTYSTGPHIGIGVHAPDSWDRMYNPQPLISDLLAGKDTSSVPAHNQLQSGGLGWIPLSIGIGGTGTGGDTPQQQQQGGQDFKSTSSDCSQYAGIDPRGWICNLNLAIGNFFSSYGMRIVKVLLGLGLFSTGIVLFVAGSLGGDIAAAGVTAAGMPEAAPFASAALRGRGGPVRSIGNAIRTRGAIAGQRTLNERKEQGRNEGREEFVRLLKAERSDAAKRGAATKKAKREAAAAEAAKAGKPAPAAPAVADDLGDPVYINLGEGKRGPLVGYERNGMLYNPQGQEIGAFEQEMNLPAGMIPGTPEYEARQRTIRKMRGQLGYKEES